MSNAVSLTSIAGSVFSSLVFLLGFVPDFFSDWFQELLCSNMWMELNLNNLSIIGSRWWLIMNKAISLINQRWRSCTRSLARNAHIFSCDASSESSSLYTWRVCFCCCFFLGNWCGIGVAAFLTSGLVSVTVRTTYVQGGPIKMRLLWFVPLLQPFKIK